MAILNLYSEASGQKINPAKSSVKFSRFTPKSTGHEILQMLGMQEMNQSKRYLSLPIHWGTSNTRALKFLIDKISNKTQRLKNKLLSQASCEILIKVILTAVHSYAMACFQFPKAFYKTVNSLLANFWWVHKNNNNKIHWVKWETLTKPKKSQGGMGIKDFETFNLAFLTKQAWHRSTLLDNLWSTILKGIYFPHGNLWTAKNNFSSLLVVEQYLSW